LKNVLLVMSSGGYLKRPDEGSEQTEQQRRLWTDTSKRLSKFLPDLMPELFPEPEAKEVVPENTEASVPTPAVEEKTVEVA
jgi:brefeldin A-resistance guanine nucleotide exchange factor 1